MSTTGDVWQAVRLISAGFSRERRPPPPLLSFYMVRGLRAKEKRSCCSNCTSRAWSFGACSFLTFSRSSSSCLNRFLCAYVCVCTSVRVCAASRTSIASFLKSSFRDQHPKLKYIGPSEFPSFIFLNKRHSIRDSIKILPNSQILRETTNRKIFPFLFLL